MATSLVIRRRLLSLLTALLVLGTGTLFSCQKEDAYAPEQATVQVLSVSTTTPAVTQGNADNTAFALEWTQGTNHGTQAAIDYIIQIAKAGTSFAAPVDVPVERGVYTKAYRTSAFNDLLADSLGLPVGTAATVEIRVKSVEASKTQAPDYSNVVTVTATPYAAVSTIYIVGDATPTGWDINQAVALTRSPTNSALFTYSEVLRAGEFKLPTARSLTAPFYGPLTNHPSLSDTGVQLITGSPDNKWLITSPGAYQISLNINTMTVSIVPFTPPAQLWLVGSATVNGWNIGNATPMTVSPSNPTIFTYTGPFVPGEFKIATVKDFTAPFYRPLFNHPPLSEREVQLTAGASPDEKWEITAATAGTHTITLDVLHLTVDIR